MNCKFCNQPMVPARWHWEPGWFSGGGDGSDDSCGWDCKNCKYSPHYYKKEYIYSSVVKGPLVENSITFTVPFKGNNYRVIVYEHDKPYSGAKLRICQGDTTSAVLYKPIKITIDNIARIVAKMVPRVKCYICKQNCVRYHIQYDVIVIGATYRDTETWSCSNHKIHLTQEVEVTRTSKKSKHNKRTIIGLWFYLKNKQYTIDMKDTMTPEKAQTKISTILTFS